MFPARITAGRSTFVVAPEFSPRGGPLPAIAVACVVAGLGLRLFAYSRGQPLWGDEAMLALNVLGRDAAGLFDPLDRNQGAPVGYLLLVKLGTALFGGSEFALRLPSFLATIIAVLAFVPFARRALPRSTAGLAVVLLALSPQLAGYAGECKQYALDAAVCVALLALGRPVWVGDARPGHVVALAVGGAAAVWLSHPAAFVLGGVWVAVAMATGRAAVRVGAAWASSFAVCYWLVLRHLGGNAYLLEYWAGTFLPLPPNGPGDVAWLVNHCAEMFASPGGFGGPGFGLAGLAGVCFLIGCAGLWRDDRRLFAAVVVPILLCLLASGLKRYPFAGRLLMFAVPLLVIGVAAGAVRVAAALNESRPRVGWLYVAAVVLGPVAECGQLLKRPIHAEDVRGAVQKLAVEWSPGDGVFLSPGAEAGFAYYAGRAGFAPDNVHIGTSPEDLRAVPPGRRVWVLLGHFRNEDESAARVAVELIEMHRGADAVLFRLLN